MRRLINISPRASQSMPFAVLMGLSVSTPIHAETAPILPLDKHVFEQFCTPEGGYAGIFGAAETAAEAKREHPDKTRPLSPAIGPFFQSETWFTSESRIAYALRYEAHTTDALDARLLALQLAPIAEANGWKGLPTTSRELSISSGGRWFKNVQSSDGPTRLLLFTDGGSETTSLYCVRVDLKDQSEREFASSTMNANTAATAETQ